MLLLLLSLVKGEVELPVRLRCFHFVLFFCLDTLFCC